MGLFDTELDMSIHQRKHIYFTWKLPSLERSITTAFSTVIPGDQTWGLLYIKQKRFHWAITALQVFFLVIERYTHLGSVVIAREYRDTWISYFTGNHQHFVSTRNRKKKNRILTLLTYLSHVAIIAGFWWHHWIPTNGISRIFSLLSLWESWWGCWREWGSH